MSDHPKRCPNCQQITVLYLEQASREANVRFYRCASCGFLWTVAKRRDGFTDEVKEAQ
jgi:DNA-directed RNA polymerase subunit M/transcription elongation factor TFIIS